MYLWFACEERVYKRESQNIGFDNICWRSAHSCSRQQTTIQRRQFAQQRRRANSCLFLSFHKKKNAKMMSTNRYAPQKTQTYQFDWLSFVVDLFDNAFARNKTKELGVVGRLFDDNIIRFKRDSVGTSQKNLPITISESYNFEQIILFIKIKR